ncbi:hypothetical protein VNO77_16922 [Canavalia gladiata]|uniref:RING-type E3 ubiquitin transferase n=1 Tax=Canavalia gladiata TaxID=3824 RepID=A0AAN9LLR0_CANGL
MKEQLQTFLLHHCRTGNVVSACPYVDGPELYRLLCTHHFHSGCISRWLRTKATCPLCKFNILRGDTLV